MSYKKETKPSVSDGDRNVTIVNLIFDLYRRSHYYSLRKNSPTIYQKALNQTKKYPTWMLEEALEIYIKAKGKDNKRPHPNYFLAICKRIYEDEDTNKPIWGKIL